MLEWVSYHVRQGVTHFYLYDHHSTDDHLEVLSPLIDAGLVSVTPARSVFQGPKEAVEKVLESMLITQLSCLAHWYKENRNEVEWILSIDIDGFIFSRQPLTELISGTNKFSGVGGVSLARIPFSTDGRAEKLRRDELAILTFGERLKQDRLTREQGKIVYYVPRLNRMYAHLHLFDGSSAPLADVNGRINETTTGLGLGWDGSTVQRVEDEPFLVHHLARSLESCNEKRALSERSRGAWRHRVPENYCNRRHRGSRDYMKRWFVRDERVQTGMRELHLKLCQTMRKLHSDYCEKWDCCGAVPHIG